ncbi:MAG: 2-hydroxychromene-2-carboxylate isomerase [Pseudomonadota bacterium]
MAIVDYYLSLNSPWTFLGAQRFAEIVKRHGAIVRTKPTNFGEVFAATGGLPLPKRAPERQTYRMMELKRWRAHLDVPIVLEPEFFPSDETAGVRLVIAAELAGLDALAISIEIGRELWERDHNIGEESALKTAVTRAGVDYEALTQSMPDDAQLDAVWAANTKEAVSRGVFGAPSYVLESGEIFWGQDRVEFVDRALAAL